ncbi:MAG: hypothetical protein J0I11_09195 [Actinobacteria bacterium]|nr:hypothetical protein [Actinomycetota bacterium]
MMRSGRRTTLLLSLALAVLMVAGAGAAFAVGHAQRAAVRLAGAGSAGSAGQAPSASPSAGTADGSVGEPAATVGSIAVSVGAPPTDRTTGTADPSASKGPVAVGLSPRAESTPQARDVTDLISRYFTAINGHDYDAWLSTVTTAQAKRDRDDWTRDYSTTRDSDVYISDITAGNPLTVRMQFTSHQAIQFAPAELQAQCVRWDVTYRVQDEGVGLRVGTSAKPPAIAPC